MTNLLSSLRYDTSLYMILSFLFLQGIASLLWRFRSCWGWSHAFVLWVELACSSTTVPTSLDRSKLIQVLRDKFVLWFSFSAGADLSVRSDLEGVCSFEQGEFLPFPKVPLRPKFLRCHRPFTVQWQWLMTQGMFAIVHYLIKKITSNIFDSTGLFKDLNLPFLFTSNLQPSASSKIIPQHTKTTMMTYASIEFDGQPLGAIEPVAHDGEEGVGLGKLQSLKHKIAHPSAHSPTFLSSLLHPKKTCVSQLRGTDITTCKYGWWSS